MQVLKFIKNIFIIFVALGVAFLLLGYLKSKNQNSTNQIPAESSFISQKGVEIFINNPKYEDVVSSPLRVSGKMPGNWFFEASAPITILNQNREVLGQSYVSAIGEWMTTDYVDFSGEINFTQQISGQSGFLILQKDNASGEPQFDDNIEIKIIFN